MTIPQQIADTIVDPKAYAEGKPVDDAFSFLRKEMPLAQATPEGYDPFWVVTKHADILEVERQNDLFHNGDRAATLVPKDVDQKVREMMGGSPHLVRSLVQMDNPDHMAYRRITQGAFLPQNLRKLEDRIREIARGFIDRMAAKGDTCDFARDVAFLYPLHVIMEVLGVPEVDEPRMLKLTQELFGSADPELNRLGAEVKDPAAGLAAVAETVGEFITYFNEMTEDRRRKPREDLASLIANATIDGQPLDHFAAMSYYIIAATAGHDTTSNTTAGGLWAIAERPDQFKRLKADPSLIPSFLEETIRWVTPVKHFMRTATADAEVHGQKIAKGDWMMLCYPSGNRDEDVFADPFDFKIDRSPNKHVAFGYGAHVCLGQHLGRMEMRVLWEELLPRLESVELNGTPKLMQANFVCGPKSVPIRFKMH
ncbi:cytochrome P450 [Parvibaculum sp.]|uniref:cytochrome P450 n=1 Tax=Parvibaculum sp. TaxID=2024848 RepID=UPI0032107821